MAEIREQDIIKALEHAAAFELPAGAADRDIETVRKRLKAGARPPERKLWRTIMESRWTKLTSAAAAVIIAVCLGFNLLHTPRLEAAELLSQVADSMSKLNWIKTVSKTYAPGKEESATTDLYWIDLRNKRVFAIFGGKYIHLMDYNAWEWSIYRPETKDMIIKPLSGEWGSPAGEIEKTVEKLQAEGIEVAQSDGVYRGRKAIILQYDELLNYLGPKGPVTNTIVGGKYVRTIRTKLIIEEKTRFMGAREVSYFDDAGGLIRTTKRESTVIDKGPADVYELGVPADVKIINKLRSPKVNEIRQKIEEHKTAFLKGYIAVITEARVEGGRERISEAFAVFSNGDKLRVDAYRAVYGFSDKVTGRYRSELAASLNLLTPYWPEKERAIQSVRLYDGLWQYVLEVKDPQKDDNLTAWAKQRRPDGDLYADDDVEDFAWRTLGWLEEPEHLYEDEYSRANGLLAMELTWQAQFSYLPKRQVIYVDPQKDYVCHRYVEQNLFDAPWQEDKDWLEAKESKSGLTEAVTDREVTEYAQTSDGKWYPKVIREKGYRQSYGRPRHDEERIVRIHLIAENPQFPDGIFDPANLPQTDE